MTITSIEVIVGIIVGLCTLAGFAFGGTKFLWTLAGQVTRVELAVGKLTGIEAAIAKIPVLETKIDQAVALFEKHMSDHRELAKQFRDTQDEVAETRGKLGSIHDGE